MMSVWSPFSWMKSNQSLYQGGQLLYDFYNPNNICVISREDPHLPDGFADSPYIDVPREIYNKYHLSTWILDVLGLNN